ncbi:MAG: hypothetical protein JO264_01295 [Acidisphaera sp.]|nr:hypothetical protein [Acidisphaera sp.]
MQRNGLTAAALILLLGGCALDPFRSSASMAVPAVRLAPVLGAPAQQTAALFRDALAARGLLAGNDARFTLAVTVERFDPAPHAVTQLRVSVTDNASGQAAYRDEVTVQNDAGQVIAQDASRLGEQTLAQAVDQTLDKPALREILAQARLPFVARLVTVE